VTATVTVTVTVIVTVTVTLCSSRPSMKGRRRDRRCDHSNCLEQAAPGAIDLRVFGHILLSSIITGAWSRLEVPANVQSRHNFCQRRGMQMRPLPMGLPCHSSCETTLARSHCGERP
jgi:hypothetical protein